MKPEPRGAAGSSWFAACERGVGSSLDAAASGLVAWGNSVRSSFFACAVGGM